MKKLVVFTGSGISQESGIPTFRDRGGIWDEYNVEDVATISGWRKNPQLVLDFYNKRRNELHTVVPNDGHIALKDLEKDYDVTIITQNVDDLHERAGSTKIIHLHGELLKQRSSQNAKLVEACTKDIKLGDLCELGSQLRPDIVWFGEQVPAMDDAIRECYKADIFAVIGTSLLVYPAASLLEYTQPRTPIYVVDPGMPEVPEDFMHRTTFIKQKASNGTRHLIELL